MFQSHHQRTFKVYSFYEGKKRHENGTKTKVKWNGRFMSEAAGRLTVDIVNYYGLWSGKVWLSCVCKASSSKWQKSNQQELKE